MVDLPVTKVQNLFSTTAYTFSSSPKRAIYEFLLPNLRTTFPYPYFETIIENNCYRKLAKVFSTRYSAGSNHTIMFGTKNTNPPKWNIKIDDIFKSLDASCPITQIGISADIFGTPLSIALSSAFAFQGTEYLIPKQPMLRTPVSIWASNGVDKEHSPVFNLEFELSVCANAPRVTST